MRRFLATSPPWVVVALWAVVTVALWMLPPANDGGGSWVVDFVTGCFVVALAGPFMWFDGRRQRRKADCVTGPLTRPQRQAVYRAAGTGVPPADPALHRPALELARYQLAGTVRGRTATVALLSVLLAAAVLFAVIDWSLWWALYAVVFGVVLVSTLADPPRQRRRVARLEQATGRSAHPAWRA